MLAEWATYLEVSNNLCFCMSYLNLLLDECYDIKMVGLPLRVVFFLGHSWEVFVYQKKITRITGLAFIYKIPGDWQLPSI